MCVIIVGDERRKPSEIEVRACWARNPHGAGFASYAKDGSIVWQKGIENVERVLELIDECGSKFVAHFRFATVGRQGAELCHPFPISKKAPRSTAGSGSGAVLFHNGTVREWRKMSTDFLLSHADAEMPHGDLSDSRVVSWLAAHKGYRMLQLLPGRWAVVTRDRGIRLFGPWKPRGQCQYSNLDWTTAGSERDGSVVWPRRERAASWMEEADRRAEEAAIDPRRPVPVEDPGSLFGPGDACAAGQCASCHEDAHVLVTWSGHEVCPDCYASLEDEAGDEPEAAQA